MVIDIRPLIAHEIPHLRRFGLLVTANLGEADDLVCATLKHCLERPMDRGSHQTVRNWLFATLYRLYSEQHDSDSTSPVPGSLLDSNSTDDRAHRDRPAGVRGHEFVNPRSRLERDLWHLPDLERLSLLLIALEGLSYTEASAILDLPNSAIQSKLCNARRQLSEHGCRHDA